MSIGRGFDSFGYVAELFVDEPLEEWCAWHLRSSTISLKPYYVLSSNIGTFAGVGYILGDASGFDLSLGGNYIFGKEKSYSFALIAYMSSLEVDGNKESSNAFIGSFGYGF